MGAGDKNYATPTFVKLAVSLEGDHSDSGGRDQGSNEGTDHISKQTLGGKVKLERGTGR